MWRVYKTNTNAHEETIEILNDFILWDCDCAQSFLENFKHYLGLHLPKKLSF